MNSDDICPICKNPKTTTPGSMTQWIVACTCDAVPLDDSEFEEIKVDICKTCGKRISEGRSGSFTQFIFRSDTCQCERPEFDEEIENLGLQPSEETYEEQEFEDQEESELKLEDPSKFPLERYKPLELLGAGSSGAVYLARDKFLNKRVSVKILSEFNSKTLMAFQNEAKKTVQLNHPSIIEVLDFGITEAQTPFMVLEYFPGVSLEKELEVNGPLSFEDTRAIFSKICDAVSYANNNNIYHRDIKPGNILILDKNPENVRLIDFGIAAASDSNTDKTSSPSSGLIGTPLFMSPEISSGANYDERCEVYSISCVLYMTLTGSPPYLGETVLETLTMHKNEPRPKIEEFENTQLNTEVSNLIQKGMAVNPDERIGNALEFKEALMSIEYIDTTPSTTPERSESRKGPLKTKNIMAKTFFAFLIVSTLGVASAIYKFPGLFKSEKDAQKPHVTEKVKKKSDIPDEKTVIEGIKAVGWLGKKWDFGPGSIRGIEVTDEDFKDLKIDPKVTVLRVAGGSTQFTGSGLKYIADHEFSKVTIVSIGFNDDGAKELSKFKNLSRLSIQQNHALTIEGMKYLTSIKGLHLFSLRFMDIPEGTADLIVKSKTINAVELGHIKNLTARDIEKICSMPKLMLLQIANAPVGDSIIPFLLKRKLRQLNINGTNITSKGLLQLAKMKSLRSIKISIDDGIDEAACLQFKKLLPKCRIETDHGFSLGARNMETFKGLTLPEDLK